MRLEKALVGVDLSPISDNLVKWLPYLSKVGVKTIILSYVVPSTIVEHVAGGILVDKLVEEHVSEAKKVLSVYEKRLSEAGFEVKETEVRVGEPAPVLASQAEKYGADLIVVGSRGRGWLREILLGSTVEELARLAKKPLLVVKGLVSKKPDGSKSISLPGNPFTGPLLAAIDFHEYTDKVLKCSSTIARKTGQRIVLVHVVERDEDPDEAHRILEDHVSTLRDAGLSVEPVIVKEPGNIAKTIILEAEKHKATLLIVGPRGKGGSILSGLLGSTTDTVLRYSRVPVIICR
ncbi:MAG: universal stress protein [Pyrodictiaceae archaeon]